MWVQLCWGVKLCAFYLQNTSYGLSLYSVVRNERQNKQYHSKDFLFFWGFQVIFYKSYLIWVICQIAGLEINWKLVIEKSYHSKIWLLVVFSKPMSAGPKINKWKWKVTLVNKNMSKIVLYLKTLPMFRTYQLIWKLCEKVFFRLVSKKFLNMEGLIQKVESPETVLPAT